MLLLTLNLINENIYLHTSLALEKVDDLITSGAIHAYVPAADILVVLYTSLARPKSVILSVLFCKLFTPTGSLKRTKNIKFYTLLSTI